MRILLLIFWILCASPVQAGDLLVIASPQVPDNAISREQLADIYLLKRIYWSDKIPVVPINREVSSNVREKFSEDVFNLSPQELAAYWNRQRFQGKFPPLIQASDQAVLAFVRSIPGAIGYINANQVPAGVKLLLRIP
jgi:ABC-type phosphate transport system substrate-binding protein